MNLPKKSKRMVPRFSDESKQIPTAQVIVVYSTKESQFMFPRDWQA